MVSKENKQVYFLEPRKIINNFVRDQFIDHDITRERQTILENQNIIDINTLTNDRTSWFDLDSVYGDNNSLLNADGLFDLNINQLGEEDLPRNPDGTARIGDPRNEENLITAGLHFVFLKFHNRVIQELKTNNPSLLLPQLIIEAKKNNTMALSTFSN